MKMSVMLFPFHQGLGDGTLPPQELVERLAAEGVTAFEPSMRWVMDRPQAWQAFLRSARDAAMTCCCCDIIVNLIGESEADRTQALDDVERGVELCRGNLDCPVALVAGTSPAPDMSFEEGRGIYAEQLAKAVQRTRGSGVTITIENYGMIPGFTASGAECLEVLEAANCPDLKFTFDNGNFLFSDDRPTQAFDMLAHRTAHVHIKDFALCRVGDRPVLTSVGGSGYKHCPIGEGEGEVTETVAFLKAHGYADWLSIEVGGDDPLQEAATGARLVKDLWTR